MFQTKIISRGRAAQIFRIVWMIEENVSDQISVVLRRASAQIFRGILMIEENVSD